MGLRLYIQNVKLMVLLRFILKNLMQRHVFAQLFVGYLNIGGKT